MPCDRSSPGRRNCPSLCLGDRSHNSHQPERSRHFLRMNASLPAYEEPLPLLSREPAPLRNRVRVGALSQLTPLDVTRHNLESGQFDGLWQARNPRNNLLIPRRGWQLGTLRVPSCLRVCTFGAVQTRSDHRSEDSYPRPSFGQLVSSLPRTHRNPHRSEVEAGRAYSPIRFYPRVDEFGTAR